MGLPTGASRDRGLTNHGMRTSCVARTGACNPDTVENACQVSNRRPETQGSTIGDELGTRLDDTSAERRPRTEAQTLRTSAE